MKAVLWTLSEPNIIYATKWIAGKSLSAKKTAQLDLPENFQYSDADIFNRIRQILNLASLYSPLVICFDQIDAEGAGISESGLHLSQIIALFAMELCESLKKIVVVTSLFRLTWKDYIRALPNAESVVDRIAEVQCDLKGLNSDDVVGLVSTWLDDFYRNFAVNPPYPIYPFDEAELRAFGNEKPSTRNVLKWCRENWNNQKILPSEQIEMAFENSIAGLNPDDFMEEKTQMAKALIFAFNNLIGKIIENVQIDEIQEFRCNTQQSSYSLDFKICGNDNGEQIKIGVILLQSSNGMTINAGLKRLTDYKKFDLTRGCLVRSRKINPTAYASQKLKDKLLLEQGGEWILLAAEEIKPLLAIHELYQNLKDADFSEDELMKYIQDKRFFVDNLLIKEILSAPEGVEPEDTLDEDVSGDLNNSCPQDTENLEELNLSEETDQIST
ncbi:MAG: hypothetical protein HC799_14195 [Limnothrix sp. RL_2_0]|nr:hypothetical protein [Limnothrix sp. RL_2_0]